jgi:potassium efflux system protein
VGDTGGTVEKINIRATIVTNWDRQTIIVPNKNFITQNLTNWTRNDQIMRRRIPVGVAYGSDVEKVLKILHDVTEGHEKVVKDPPPRIWFEQFGESSLDFEVWIFCLVSEGKQTMSELRTRIYARFNEEGIQIPFPQRDLHLRSIDDDVEFRGGPE